MIFFSFFSLYYVGWLLNEIQLSRKKKWYSSVKHERGQRPNTTHHSK